MYEQTAESDRPEPPTPGTLPARNPLRPAPPHSRTFSSWTFSSRTAHSENEDAIHAIR
ncbi:hypothetical protein SAMN06272771_7540 [Streptomyces sp. Ag82_O1-12]|nr:hypothetical protein SAMN06272771_7540 [Streptomyces sp. Ag82_O1-12]SOD50034.1 hypothetical protein SAMN06272727_7547 [Streptomyces sp. Ag82_G6-1]